MRAGLRTILELPSDRDILLVLGTYSKHPARNFSGSRPKSGVPSKPANVSSDDRGQKGCLAGQRVLEDADLQPGCLRQRENFEFHKLAQRLRPLWKIVNCTSEKKMHYLVDSKLLGEGEDRMCCREHTYSMYIQYVHTICTYKACMHNGQGKPCATPRSERFLQARGCPTFFFQSSSLF